jgi:(p)ppGpp synthase/HD superfamily hydrolase
MQPTVVVGDETTLLLSAMCASVAVGGMLMMGARSMWSQMEPWILSLNSESGYDSDDAGSAGVEELFGIDVGSSKYFGRERVRQAVDMASKAHDGQYRKTKQPYITHCIETALIVEALLSPNEDDDRAEDAIISALLHDVIDDAGIDPEEIRIVFGDQVMSMVTKVSQLSATNQLVRRKLRLEQGKQTRKEIDKLRAMIVTMVSEPLVIVIKLADRLHNMRTVYALAPDKQMAVAGETQKIWCSLAERLGMFAVKSELEDLCFAVLQPATYGALRGDLEEIWGLDTIPELCYAQMDEQTLELQCDDVENPPTWLGSLDAAIPLKEYDGSKDSMTDEDPEAAFLSQDQIEIRNLIQTVLPFDASTFNMNKIRMTPSARRGLEVLQRCAKVLLQELVTEGVATDLEITVQGRVKSLYSSFKKMARKGVPLSEVYDVRALRVVVDDRQGQNENEAIEICYKVLPVVHRLWRKVPGEDDDYIAMPKPSGYQSLHTAVIGPGGVPMEVQIRTALMHEEAEYGKAAHWAYKESPVGGMTTTESAADPMSMLKPGHPVLRISSNGKLRDAIIVKVENDGNRLLIASSYANKSLAIGSPIAADWKTYQDLFTYVTEKGYFKSSQGDMKVSLELFTMCSDNKYHQIDRFGHKKSTSCVPLQVPGDRAPLASYDDGARRDSLSSSKSETELMFMNNRIKLLRSMIEWGVDVEDEVSRSNNQPAEVEEEEEEMERDLMILAWPSGKIMRVPKGTTAGEFCDMNTEEDVEPPVGLINVNNRLVKSDFALSDGDFVVLSKEVSKVSV